eukprot:1723228-Pyramimonas_sp.AAC.1
MVVLMVPICWPWGSAVVWRVALLACSCWVIGLVANVWEDVAEAIVEPGPLVAGVGVGEPT